MTVEAPAGPPLVATLDHDRGLPLDKIPAADLSRVVARVARPERTETAPAVASFNSSI